MPQRGNLVRTLEASSRLQARRAAGQAQSGDHAYACCESHPTAAAVRRGAVAFADPELRSDAIRAFAAEAPSDAPSARETLTRMPIEHFGIGVSDVEAAKVYDDELMPMVGYRPCFETGYSPTDWQGAQLFLYPTLEDGAY